MEAGVASRMKTVRACSSRWISVEGGWPTYRSLRSYQTSTPRARRAATKASHSSLSWCEWLTKTRCIGLHLPCQIAVLSWLVGSPILAYARKRVNRSESAACGRRSCADGFGPDHATPAHGVGVGVVGRGWQDVGATGTRGTVHKHPSTDFAERNGTSPS